MKAANGYSSSVGGARGNPIILSESGFSGLGMLISKGTALRNLNNLN